MEAHMCFGINEKCYNLEDSYGEICVWCNCCGRVDKNKMWLARYETDKRHLIENIDHINKVGYLSEVQQTNVIKNISCYRARLEASRKHLKFKDPICPKCGKGFSLYETDGKVKCYHCDFECDRYELETVD